MRFPTTPLGSVLESYDSGEWGGDPIGDNDIPVVRVADIEPDYSIDWASAPLRNVSPQKVSSKTLEEYDVLVVKASGSSTNIISGRSALVRGLGGKKYGFANFLLRLKVDRNQYDPYLLTTIMNSSAFRKRIPEVVSSTTYPNLRIEQFLNLPIPKPTLPQQSELVDLLSRAENIVRMRREAEARAKEIIPALFLDMFGDPETNPKGWQLMSLGDVFAQKPNYGTMIPARAEQMPWLCLRVANIQGGRLTLSDRKYVSLPADAVERHEVRSGDILMARAIGSVDHLGKCVVAQVEGEKWAFDSHLMRIRLQADRADPVWLQALLSSEGGRRLFLEKTRRTAVQFNINTKEMAAIRVPVPPVDRQCAFAHWVTKAGGLECQQRSASVAAEGAFHSLLAGVFGEAG